MFRSFPPLVLSKKTASGLEGLTLSMDGLSQLGTHHIDFLDK